MKGLSETMLIIITVVVILVAALVLLAIFQGTITPTGGSLECQARCQTAKFSCTAADRGNIPAEWVKAGCADTKCVC